MKRFFKRLLFFILPLMLLFLSVEYSLRSIKSSYEQKRNGLINSADSIEILILGNSHAADGINPYYLGRPAYSLAFASQSILYDKQLLFKYFKILKNLKYVVLSVDYPSLYWGYNKERDFFYYHYHGINLKNKSYFKEYLSYFFYVYTPKPSIQLLFNRPEITTESGWSGIDSTNHKYFSKEAGKRRVEIFNADIKKSIETKENELVCSELESIIVFLKENNIKPIIITLPCYKYFTYYLDSKTMNHIQDYVNHLNSKYNLPYLNALYDTSFTESDFYDVDHLNKYGAAKFTLTLDSFIRKLDICESSKTYTNQITGLGK